MKLSRREFLHLAVAGAALPTLPLTAHAQAYPTRPVRWIVGYLPGGPNDVVARLIGQWLSERLGQPFIVENRPGAGTNIATEAAVKAPPDGYTLLQVSASAAINATLYEKLNFNFIRDIHPSRASSASRPSWSSIQRFQRQQSPSSSLTRRPIQVRSVWPRPASEAFPIWPASCSRQWPA